MKAADAAPCKLAPAAFIDFFACATGPARAPDYARRKRVAVGQTQRNLTPCERIRDVFPDPKH
jgi:hypothetical protein